MLVMQHLLLMLPVGFSTEVPHKFLLKYVADYTYGEGIIQKVYLIQASNGWLNTEIRNYAF